MSEPTIKLGTVEVPLLDYAIGATAILGIRDSGKTVTAKGIAEQLHDHSIPFIVFDAVGKWRWLKVPATGRRGAKGFKVVVVGGRQPDLPLNPHSITDIVRASIKENVSLVIDLYDPHLSKADWRRIVQQSIRTIHYENEGVRHVILEEAAEYIPQKVMDGETYAEVEKFVRMGGNASVGITLINQRSQEVNKAVLDLCTHLILGCQIGSKAIEAVEKWVDRLAPDIAEKVTQSLPGLSSGQDWVWTRANPDKPVLVQFPMCRSLHPDRRTPEATLNAARPVDTESFVSALTDSLPKVIEERKSNDVGELKRTVADLRKQLAQKSPPPAEAKTKAVPAFTEQDFKRFEASSAKLEKLLESNRVAVNEMADSVTAVCSKKAHEFAILEQRQRDLRQMLEKVCSIKPAAVPVSNRPVHVPRPTVHAKPHPVHTPPVDGDRKLGKCERALLTAAIQRHPQQSSRAQLSVLAGYSVTSSTFDNGLGALRSMGFIEGAGDNNAPTPAGIAEIPNVPPLPTGPALVSEWTRRLGKAERSMLEIIVRYPDGIDRDQLSAESGYSGGSSTFDNAVGKLRSLELVSRGWPVKPTEELL